MRTLPRTALLALVLATPAFAHDETQQFITTGAELQDWCRTESEAEFVARNLKAYNWIARHHERGNTLIVEGHWRIDGTRHDVTCRVARGAQREHATLQIAPAS